MYRRKKKPVSFLDMKRIEKLVKSYQKLPSRHRLTLGTAAVSVVGSFILLTASSTAPRPVDVSQLTSPSPTPAIATASASPVLLDK